ncbi:MAG: helix-turn-helix transcriptional regulator [Candidatus Woesebacteria bacterium]
MHHTKQYPTINKDYNFVTNTEDIYLKQFGKRLARVRKSRKLTQQELADLLGISHGSIAFIETGKRWPRPATIYRLANALQMPVGELFEDNTTIQQPQVCVGRTSLLK